MACGSLAGIECRAETPRPAHVGTGKWTHVAERLGSDRGATGAFLEPETEYKLEVIAVEDSGNKTITETGLFETDAAD